MPRFGKGKPMAEQARNLLKGHLALDSRHAAKRAAGVKGGRSTGKIHSIATFNKYAGTLKNAGEWLKAEHQIRHLDKVTPVQAQAYLQHRRESGIGQKQLDADRNALQFITGRLEQVHAVTPQKLDPRAYSAEQVRLVAGRQTERNALSTELVYRTGLRAHELFTLKRQDEAQPFAHRTWHPARFQGRDGVRYIATGKGGLSREILIPHDLAMRLEERRLEEPRVITDRGIHYQSHYAINGGQAWSESFSAASNAALDRSTGGHGLRHSYAQERLGELQARYHSYKEAKLILSQELGHFRADVVNAYLR
ncbi:MAG: site-specific integrase [Geminicoccaceae bacterium]